MSTTHDYIPNNDRAFLTWLFFMLAYVEGPGTTPRFGVPAADIAALKALGVIFEGKLDIAENAVTRTKAAVKDKTEARAVTEKAAREFVNEHLAFNRSVTPADRENMQITVRKTTRDDAPVADVAPIITARDDGARRVRFDFGESHTSRAKPAGQHSVRIAWLIREEAPATYEELINSKADTHTPLILTFDVPEAGKRLWFAARWVNTVEIEGPWTEIQSVIIP
ncbi:MAG: hypothetical protein LBS12_06950 [Prevotellaceae bacterium]|jgi:hypothetical protein|nr:hypothetical protein [Prevotellaceae bacterium]